jgi:N-acetyl-gamma-glutamyl-phosphate reductase
VNRHQHIPEIAQILSRLAGKKAGVTFVPYLLPLRRGILTTVYAFARRHLTTASAVKLYAKFYKDEPFVRVRPEGDFPKIRDVVNTNFCDICVRVDGNRVIVISAIDNLVKGASGQAVQNMNIRFGFPQTAGLL